MVKPKDLFGCVSATQVAEQRYLSDLRPRCRDEFPVEESRVVCSDIPHVVQASDPTRQNLLSRHYILHRDPRSERVAHPSVELLEVPKLHDLGAPTGISSSYLVRKCATKASSVWRSLSLSRVRGAVFLRGASDHPAPVAILIDRGEIFGGSKIGGTCSLGFDNRVYQEIDIG